MNMPINLCFVFDEKFADFFKVALLSIDSNTSSELAVYIVDCGISEEKRTELEQFASTLKNVVSLQFGLPERIDAIENYTIPPLFSTAVFYRLAIPKIFQKLERVIYLDCDIIADGDIVELWNEDLAGCPFGAVEEDGNFFNSKSKRRHKERIGVLTSKKYFLSGMLLIDCKKFEESRIFERVIKCIQTSNVVFSCPEQDAMNVCLNNDEHYPLSPKYNFCPFFTLACQCLHRISVPIIIHYGGIKPWKMNKRFVKLMQVMCICSYSAGMWLRFWKYSDRIDSERYQSKEISYTLIFFYKRLFQPIEKLLTGKLFKR